MRYSILDKLRQCVSRLPRRTVLVPAVIGASMIALITGVWWVTPTSETMGHEVETRNELANFSARLESHIATRLAIGEQLRRLLIGGQIQDRDDFLTQTSYIHELFTDFQAINWVDSLGVIRWVSPFKGNEKAQNLDVRKLDLPGIAITEAERTGRLQITPPIRLAQGGRGFTAYIPVIKMGRVTGFINIVFRAEPLIRAAMPDDMLDKYEVTILDEESSLFNTDDTGAARDGGFHKWIVIGNRVWTISLLPKQKIINAYDTIVDELVLATLILLSIVITWLIHLAMVRQLRVKASDKLFRTFIENSPSAIIIKDAEGRYLHANSQWHEWFNPEGLDIRGLTSEEFFPPGYAVEVRRQEEQIIARRDMVEKEYVSPLMGGGTIPTFVQMFPIMDDAGTVIAIGGSITDISMNKKTEETLRLALMKAEEASQSKSKFLATMSHELRTPLNAIIGFSDILLGEYFGPVGSAKYMEYAADINHSGRHLLSLINEVLDISAIELGQRKLVVEPVIVQELLSDCVKSVRHRAETQGIMVALFVEPGLPPISADETAVRQIFLNLLTNAIKFSHAGDKITVAARAGEDAVVISVADTGEGIKKEQLPTITEPFVKGHSTSHITHEGVGLGLSIVKSFVAAHKGTLSIESEVGRGTTVTVTLPKENDRMVA